MDSRYAAIGIAADIVYKYQENSIQDIFRDFNLKKQDIDFALSKVAKGAEGQPL